PRRRKNRRASRRAGGSGVTLVLSDARPAARRSPSEKEVPMQRYPLWVGTIGVAVLATVTLGCDDTAKGVKKDTEENAEAAKPYVDAAAQKTKEALKDA